MMRVFKSTNVDIVKDCMTHFNIELCSSLVNERKERFVYSVMHDFNNMVFVILFDFFYAMIMFVFRLRYYLYVV